MTNETNDTRLQAHRVYRLLGRGFGPDALERALAEGMIAKDQLVDGAMYLGWCRNAEQARWDASQQQFVYKRTKFGACFDETIVHPQDDDGFDIFVPMARLDEKHPAP